MKPIKMNLLHPDGPDARRPRRFSFWKGALIGVAALAVIVPMVFSFASVRLADAMHRLNPESDKKERVGLFETMKRLVGTSERELRGMDRDRINILMMGEGGEGHDGAHLTDTILFASIQPSTGKVAVLSLPRDLWVPIPGIGRGKINAANAMAEKKEAGSGGAFATQVVSDLIDQPVDYYVRVDFSAFKTLIDDVGGVTVNVERPFVDYAYPTDNNLYQTVRFEKGWQTMSGETALKYSRSRHGNNGEGSDFARSRRQQQVMVALKEKLVSFDTLLNPSRVAGIMETLQSHVITNIELWEVVQLAKIAKNVDTSGLVHHVLTDDAEGPLYATTIPLSNGDAYVLLPRREDWSEIRLIARDIYTPRGRGTAKAAERPLRVEVRNGTTRPGLAQKTRDLLTKIGYDVTAIGNARDREYEKTVIYDLTNGGSPEALSTLKNLLGAEVSLTLPGFMAGTVSPSNLALSNAEQGGGSDGNDFLVVIGKNYAN